ncbi:MAG TPA: hypothetical protein VHG08_17125 [Longimicrobium sp.]|nr:hypothetical protein [Longimicrobium sp.]
MLRKGGQVPGPAYDLAAFQAEVQKRNVHVYKGRALDIIKVLRECSQAEARAFARRTVLMLTPDDYAHTLKMPDGQIQDVYGRLIAGEGWYLKIEINRYDGQPGIVSCHPAAYDLVTRSGVVPSSGRKF